MSDDLRITIPLEPDAAYVKNLEAILPTLNVLFKCEPSSIVVEHPEPQEVQLSVKGKATITVDFALQYYTTPDDQGGSQAAIDIIGDLEKEMFICEKIKGVYEPATTVKFSNLEVTETADCITTVVTTN